jgi:hypothetical protein
LQRTRRPADELVVGAERIVDLGNDLERAGYPFLLAPISSVLGIRPPRTDLDVLRIRSSSARSRVPGIRSSSTRIIDEEERSLQLVVRA